MKAKHFKSVKKFTDIPNVGPAMEKDFLLLGIKTPEGLKGKDPLKLYKDLCIKTKSNQDPCVLDTFMAVTDFMNGAPARPWWKYTAKRKTLSF